MGRGEGAAVMLGEWEANCHISSRTIPLNNRNNMANNDTNAGYKYDGAFKGSWRPVTRTSFVLVPQCAHINQVLEATGTFGHSDT